MSHHPNSERRTPSPLAGKRILVTRAERQAGDFVRRLEDCGAEVVSFPTIAVVEPTSWRPLDESLEKLDAYDWLILTSANGVEFFMKRLREIAPNRPIPRSLRVCAVGTATAAALDSEGVRVDLIPREFKAEGVLDSLLEANGGPEGVRGLRVLLPRALVAREVLPERLRELGALVDAVEAYRNVRPRVDFEPIRALFLSGSIDAVTFTSGSTFEHFLEMAGDDAGDLLRRTVVACIGPVTAKKVTDSGIPTAVQPREFTTDGLVEALSEWFST